MAAPLAAPNDDHLASLGLEPEEGEEPWVRSVTFDGTSSGTVTVTWDTVAASAHLVWELGSDVLVEISRETVDSVKVDSQGDGHHVTITSHSDGVTGTLSATVTPAGVRLHDSLLRS
ncbi:hypothetical protein [Cellulomonas sp. SLBN-39]|uniref:hypothetical protein n=1 Tax=Cellulomonas sp. SLBN-39 TaxID=2768446 RepID=UPI0011512CC1|nr:hypothetical protein [Cellulomonas sp. SLBN-39]TQL02660.1 hypothetical protein FBY24_1740 [Cellulomonas sp. SLBN-39]